MRGDARKLLTLPLAGYRLKKETRNSLAKRALSNIIAYNDLQE